MNKKKKLPISYTGMFSVWSELDYMSGSSQSIEEFAILK